MPADDSTTSRCFTVVPAAGQSRRMGQPKLLLPWRDATLIDSVLLAWTSSRVAEVVVVVREDDAELAAACQRWPVHLVRPSRDPIDMKHSVQFGLTFINDHLEPTTADHCFIAPADLPTLGPEIIDGMIAARRDAAVVVPHFGDKQGHPILLSWPTTRQVFDLGEDEGVDRIVQQHTAAIVHFPAGDRVTDIDTPDEYRAATGHSRGSSGPVASRPRGDTK